MADVDIVVVNWNAGAQLGECLRSIGLPEAKAGFRISRCIVVDNASADGSAESLGVLPVKPEVIRNPENRGFGTACNQGAETGEAQYILFLNPDIRLYPETLGKAVAFMEETDNRQAALLGVQLVDEAGRVQPSTGRFPTPSALLYQMAGLDRVWPRRFPPAVMTDWDHRQSREVEVLQGAFLLARRAAFEALGGFDERFFMYYEDVDLAYRARQAGWKSYYLAEAQAYHRGGGVTERIKAGRLAYWMRSRAQYVAMHFGRAAAAGIVVASLTVELWSRLLWNLLRFSWGHLGDTLAAYGQYAAFLTRQPGRTDT